MLNPQKKPMSMAAAVKAYGALVAHIAWQVTRDAEATKDISQEVFTKLHLARSKGQDIEGHLRAWLGKAALNGALNFKRQNAKLVPFAEEQHPCAAGEIAAADRRLLLDKIHQLIPALPARQQAVFILRHFEGLPFDDIGQILGCSPLAARSAAFEGLKKMRAWLTGKSPQNEVNL